MEFSGLLVPGEDGLGPGTTSRGADAQDLLKCAMIIFTLEYTGQFFTRGNDPVGEFDKRSDIDRLALFAALTGRRLEFQRAHASAAGVAKALDRIEGEGQVVFRYANNPNGSARDIAGVTNAAGNVLGMMPHPERAVDADHGGTDGLALFESVLGKLS